MSTGPVTSLLSCFRRPKKKNCCSLFFHTSLRSVFLVFSRNGSSIATNSGGRRRVFQLNTDRCWTEDSAGSLKLWADPVSPRQTEPTTRQSLFLYLWSYLNFLYVMWRCLCCCQYNRHVYRNKHIVIMSWNDLSVFWGRCTVRLRFEIHWGSKVIQWWDGVQRGGWGVWGQCAFVFRLCLHLCLSAGSGAGRREYKSCKEAPRSQ